LKADVARNANGTSAESSLRHGIVVARLPVCRLYCSRMLAREARLFNVISTASLWDLRLSRQWGEGMWEYVRIEPAGSNVVLLDTVHIVTLFYCFSQVSEPGESTAHLPDDFWQHY